MGDDLEGVFEEGAASGERQMTNDKLGLIVNPVAGIGGRVGLKGSDGAEIQKKALALGAVPQSLNRAIQALEKIKAVDGVEIITYPGEMGEDAARACGFGPTVIGSIRSGETTPEDTRNAAREMLRLKVKLLLTVRDGRLRPVGIARSYTTALERLAALTEKLEALEEWSVAYTTNQGDARAVAERLGRVCSPGRVPLTRVGPGLGVHGGPGALLTVAKVQAP